MQRLQRVRPLWLGESPAENLRNAQQLLASFAFYSDEQRIGTEALDMIHAALARIDRAVKQLEGKAA